MPSAALWPSRPTESLISFSECKIRAFFGEKALSVENRFFFKFVERQLESHAELGGEQWAAEGKFKLHLIVG